MILTITLNPCIDKTIWIDKMETGRIIRSDRVTCQSGGKGNNVSRVLGNLGAPNKALTVSGGPGGFHLERLLEQEGITFRAIAIKENIRTVTTVVEKGTYFQTAYVEPGPVFHKEEIAEIMKAYEEELMDCDLVVLSGSVPYEEISWIYPEMIRMAGNKGIKVWLDSRDQGLRLGVEAQPFFIKPNLDEMEQYLGKSIGLQEREKAITSLMKKGISYVILTLGSEGAMMGCPEGIFFQKAYEMPVINPVGSGDSFTAGFLYGFSKGMSPEECLKMGCRAGAMNAAMWEAAQIAHL